MMTPRSFRPRRQTAGVALVLVLSILILLTAIVVAFFTNAATDLTASKNYSDGVKVKLLGNSTVNLVEGQIRAATLGVDSAGSGKPLAWASQPGLIRTYDTDGRQKTVYKLYSSDTLQVVTQKFNPNTELATEVPTDWNLHPSDFVDLNSPSVVVDPNGTITDKKNSQSGLLYSARYPIIDGNNLVKPKDGSVSFYDGIVPPSGGNLGTKDNVPDIEGFSVQSPTTYREDAMVAPNNNPVPMPVRWLYVLQDGQLHARVPANSQDPEAGAPGTIPGATATNPVVSRIAYWTDDDTCKLNINTASEGSFWDRPRGKNATEVAYSLNLPAQNEFQMFTGHPAKDCLSTVFGAIWPVPSSVVSATSDGVPYVVPGSLTAQNYASLLPYYDLAPRVTNGQTNGASGGSAGGTQRPLATSGIIYDTDRLYTSVDEMMFQPKMAGDNVTRLARNNIANTGGAPQALTSQYLEAARFFLTPSNRAPEVTLLNTPRVSLWPLQANLLTRTAKDKLIAFCSTVPVGSNNLYSFQRLLSIPGGGPDGSILSSDSPTLEFNESNPYSPAAAKRNVALYKYLRTLLQADVPGLGGNFSVKYGLPGSDQILTEIVDLPRSTVNIFGSDNPPPKYDYSHWGQTVPLVGPAQTNTQGFGRFVTISEAALDFFLCAPNPDDSTKPIKLGAVLVLQPFSPTPGFSSVSLDVQFKVTGLEKIYVKPSDGDDSKAQNLGFLGGTLTNIMDATTGGVTKGNCTEYNGLISSFYYDHDRATPKDFAYVPLPGKKPDSIYPFFNTVSQSDTQVGPGNLPAKTKKFDFYGKDSASGAGGAINLTVEIWSNPETTSIPPVKIQTLQLQFPPCVNLPVPEFTGAAVATTNPPPATAPVILAGRINKPDANTDATNNDQVEPANAFGLFGVKDVVRSIVVDSAAKSRGDYRVMCTVPNVPGSFFTTHPFYYINDAGTPRANTPPALDPVSTNDNWRFATSIRQGNNQAFGGYGYYNYGSSAPSQYLHGRNWTNTRKSSYNGTLIALQDALLPYYTPEAAPSVPPRTGYNGTQATGVQLTGNDGVLHPGDWDTGAGALEDGPYINKPDEGYALLANTNPFAVIYNSTSIYYSRNSASRDNGASYSPNRQVSSAVMFGSLPTGIDQTGANPKPWQTLLFCANPAAGTAHPGFGTAANGTPAGNVPPAPPYTKVPDHYVLDLFSMPIVEPYAISEPLSSQGKVNMNYQIAPFTYITRDTAVRAALKSTRLTAIPSSLTALKNYKALQPSNMTTQFRYPINPHEKDGTLKAFEDRFAVGEIFRSASEICSVPLVPSEDPTQTYEVRANGVTADPALLQAFWDKCKLTGDNLREQPYGDLYPRLTTKSNTYTVHVRVQTVKKVPGTAVNTFVDPGERTGGAKDLVTAEYRGSYQIERYVDPNLAASFPDYATDMSKPISNFYKFHTIGTKQF